jgi:HD-GYP domain-containing protein (c-di-GMP phosphodiesterase class II)
MLKRIKPTQVRLGMYIEAVEGSWAGQLFWRSRFLLSRPYDLEMLTAGSVDAIVINTDEGGDIVPSAAPGRSSQQRKADVQLKLALATIEQSGPMIREMFEDARMGGTVSVTGATEAVRHIAEFTMGSPKALMQVTRLRSRDEYTFLHSIAVTALMVHFGRLINLDEQTARFLGMGGMLHDVGKMKVPMQILNKAGPLNDREISHVRKHPAYGYELLARQGDMPDVVLDICLHHHERIDGTGYPNGLSGDRISVPVRIASICDVYDALTSKRAYKKAWPPAEAARYMVEQPGQFDQRLLAMFFYSLNI